MAELQTDNSGGIETFSCENCAGTMSFAPGTVHLACPFCQHQNEIPECREFKELNFDDFIEKAGGIPEMTVETVSCRTCGATTSLPPTLSAKPCPFCDSPLSVNDRKNENWITPGVIIPFKIDEKQAKVNFFKWANAKFFAPKGFIDSAKRADRLRGIYTPFWTFDAHATANYMGQRGTYYYVPVPYTTTVNGKTVTRVKQVRKTSWKTVSGDLAHFFDDLLISSSHQIPGKLKDKLEPWHLKEDAVSFKSEYLAGFQAEKYQTGLSDGFTMAKAAMESSLNYMAKRDIGGDEQKVLSLSADFQNVQFKHLLLPIWISTYKHGKTQYTFLINGQTGKVSGEYPISALKIIAYLLLTGALISLLVYLVILLT